MVELSITMTDYDYIYYDVGYHNRLYSNYDFQILDSGYTLQEILTDAATSVDKNYVCVAIYDSGEIIYISDNIDKSLRRFMDKIPFSGIVIQSTEENVVKKLTNNDLYYIKEAMLRLAHCACIGSIDKYHYHIYEGLSIYGITDDTESG